MTPLDEITDAARVLAESRQRLGGMVAALQRGIDALKADQLPELREAITQATDAWETVRARIGAHPELFIKPRTLSVHGIKLGYAKGKGGLEIADPDRTVKLIRKHLPEQADVLIAVKEAPAKDALAQLPAEQLKRIGVEVKGTGDQIVIKPADGDVDKLVAALVKAETEDAS